MIRCNRATPLLTATLLALVAVAAVSADDRELFDEAERRFLAGNLEPAREQFERLLGEYPASRYASRAQLRVAQTYYYAGDYAAALERLSRSAVRIVSGELAREFDYWLGLTWYQLGDAEAAYGALTSHIDGADAPRPRAWLYRGLVEIDRGNRAAAIADLERAIDVTDGADQGYAVAALMDQLAGIPDPAAVLAVWTDVSLDDPASFREQRLRRAADAAYALEAFDIAEELYEELTGYSLPSAQWAFQRLYALAQIRGTRESLQAVYRRAEQRLAGEPERLVEFWFQLGTDALSRDRLELAELYLYRIWDLRDERDVSGAVPHALATAIEEQGRPAEARAILLESFEAPRVGGEVERDRRVAAARLAIEAGAFTEAVGLIEGETRALDDAVALYLWLWASREAGGEPGELATRVGGAEAAALARDVPALARLRSRVLLDAGRLEDAIRAYRGYLAEVPDDSAARLELLRALVATGQFAAARQEAQRLDDEGVTPDRAAELAYLRALAAFNDAEYALTAELLRPLDDSGYEPLRSYHLAWAEYRLGRIDAAREAIARVVDDLPDSVRVRGGYLYAWTLMAANDAAAATTQLLRVLGFGPDGTEAREIRRLLAAAYIADRQVDAALAQYRTLLEDADDDAERARFWSQYASTLAAVGRSEEAVAEYDALAAALPDESDGRRALLDAGQLLYTADRLADARDRFRAYQNAFPDGVDLDRALFWAGATSRDLGEAGRALLWWQPLIDQFPRSAFAPRAMLGTAEIYADRDQRREALELYDRFVAAWPDDPMVSDAERRRQQIRLELDGLSADEAQLWVELEPPAGGSPPPQGGERWFELVLELGRIAIREQISLTAQRTRIIDYLLQAAEAEGVGAAEANVLLADYYRRRGETRAALDRYFRAAAVPGAPEEIQAQALYELAVLARERGEEATVEETVAELRSRFPDSVWADRAAALVGGGR